jgi:hypothetical protein
MDDITHIFQYNIAPQPYTRQLRVDYHQAIAATEEAAQALRQITAAHKNGGPYVVDRQAATLTSPDHQRSIGLPEPAVPNSESAIAAQRDGNDLAEMLRNLKVTDPALMLRAVAIDHASRSLAAEARARARLRDGAIEEAESGIRRRFTATSDRAVQIAALDQVGAGLDVALAVQRSDMPLAAASAGVQRSRAGNPPDLRSQALSARR